MTELSLGYSPCPNDTFIFHALTHGLVELSGVRLRERLEDVEALNRLAREGVLDVTKVSYGAVPWLLDEYVLLRSGGALGRGCGPLLVAREPIEVQALRGGRIAIPGRSTTANLLLRLHDPRLPAGIETVYSEIMPAVQRGEFDAGLIIHESRFTYAAHGLVALVDLGEWWEAVTGSPIPLGGIVARRSLGTERIRAIDAAVRRSLEHALRHPEASRGYVREHARELDPEVTRRHIELYVNDLSLDLGAEGERAARELLARAAAAGLAPAVERPLLPDPAPA
ncbi:MAG TPA: 1,4-dihydroxy-6-naphthoate synthase [Thermoanaerobaculia bacterium]|nr:1,4-dihydroxy-6-naphthoate synthase [Thermoanaerobaculia bacterium]